MRRLIIPHLVSLCLLLAVSAFAQEYRCASQSEVVVISAIPETNKDICDVSARTISFLAQYDLLPKRTIRVQIVEEKIDSRGYSAYGCYDSRQDLIRLMSYESILKGTEKPQMYGEPFDRVHYLGAIAHELTHAIFQHHQQTEPIGTAPQEYLAHSVQLAALPKERRSRIIRAMNVEAWQSGDTISDIYMAMEPGKFAVKSYLHLTNLSEPSEFIQILLNAKWFYIHIP